MVIWQHSPQIRRCAGTCIRTTHTEKHRPCIPRAICTPWWCMPLAGCQVSGTGHTPGAKWSQPWLTPAVSEHSPLHANLCWQAMASQHSSCPWVRIGGAKQICWQGCRQAHQQVLLELSCQPHAVWSFQMWPAAPGHYPLTSSTVFGRLPLQPALAGLGQQVGHATHSHTQPLHC